MNHRPLTSASGQDANRCRRGQRWRTCGSKQLARQGLRQCLSDQADVPAIVPQADAAAKLVTVLHPCAYQWPGVTGHMMPPRLFGTWRDPCGIDVIFFKLYQLNFG